MQENLLYILPVLALIIGIVLAYFFTKLKYEKEAAALEERTKALLNEKSEKENIIIDLKKNKEQLRYEKEGITIDLTKKVF